LHLFEQKSASFLSWLVFLFHFNLHLGWEKII